MSGWITVIWGDSDNGNTSTIYTLTSEAGQQTILLLFEEVVISVGGLPLNGKYVEVKGSKVVLPDSVQSSFPPGLAGSTIPDHMEDSEKMAE